LLEGKFDFMNILHRLKFFMSPKYQKILCSPFWMAPEVIRESHYDGRADVWSLGVTAIEMAQGQPPHADLNPMRAIFVIPQKPAPTLVNPDAWSTEMLDFIRCCCKKDPSQRYDSKRLSSHTFIRRSVNELRRIHQQRMDIRGSYGRRSSKSLIDDASNRPPGLMALQRFMKMMNQSRSTESKGNEISSGKQIFHGSAKEFENGNDDFFSGNQNGHDNNSEFFTANDLATPPRGGARSNALKKNITGQLDHSLEKISEMPEWNPNFDAAGAFSKGNIDTTDVVERESRPARIEGVFTPQDEKYRPPRPIEIDPSLANDKNFMEELEKLSKTFESKLATLRAAHELAQQHLIARAKLRNQVPLDVSCLMNKAAKRNDAEKETRQIIRQSAHCSFIPGVVQSISNMNPLSKDEFHDAMSRQQSGSPGAPDLYRSSGGSVSSETSSIYHDPTKD